MRYLRNKYGTIYPYSDTLAKRADMVECNAKEVEEIEALSIAKLRLFENKNASAPTGNPLLRLAEHFGIPLVTTE